MIKTNSLTNYENRIYFGYLEKGQKEYREKIIMGNYKLVILMAKKYVYIEKSLDDLISIGVIGLIKAVDSYKLDKNIAFSTYASRCINNEILMRLRHTETNLSIYEDCIISKDGSNMKIEEKLEANINIEEDIVNKIYIIETMKIVNELLEELDERTRKIFVDYFGLNGKKKTQEEIASEYNFSRSYVSKIVSIVLKKIRLKIMEHNDLKVLTKQKKDNTI